MFESSLNIGLDPMSFQNTSLQSKDEIINNIIYELTPYIDSDLKYRIQTVLTKHFRELTIERITYTKETTVYNNDIVEQFCKIKNLEGCTDKTINFYKKEVLLFLDYMNDKSVEYITTEEIREYLMQKMNNGASAVTTDNSRRALNSFFNFCVEEDYIIKNPMLLIKKIKAPKFVKKGFTDEELILMRDSIDDIRDMAIFELLLTSGIRVQELCNLNRRDIMWDTNSFVVYGKGRKERVCYMNTLAKMRLKEYLNTRDDDNPALFVSFRKPKERVLVSGVERRIRKIGQKCGVKAHPHKFRRTMATTALNKGVPLEQVKELLGHSDISTTLIYAQTEQQLVKQSHQRFL